MKVFGKEPAFWVGLIEAILALALSWNALGLNQEQAASIVAVVTLALGVYTAYVTRETLLGVGVGLAKSVLVLFTAFGLHFTENQTASLIALVTLVLGSYQRTQVHPVAKYGERPNLRLAA